MHSCQPCGRPRPPESRVDIAAFRSQPTSVLNLGANVAMGGPLLNDRELASTILLGLGLIAASFNRGIRSSLLSVVRAASGWKLSIIWIMYAALLSATTYGLQRVGLDYADSTKDAVVWGLIAGLPILFKFSVVGKESRLLRETLSGVVRATALVEFFINVYVFPLWAELLLQPFVAVIAITSIIAGYDEKTMPAKKLIDGVSAVLGFAVIFFVARHLAQHHDEIDGRSTLLSFAQPIVLSIAVVAMTYIVALVSSYELAFMRIGWSQPARRGRVRARLALLLTLHVRLHQVHHFTGTLPHQLADTTSWRAARRLMHDYKSGTPRPE